MLKNFTFLFLICCITFSCSDSSTETPTSSLKTGTNVIIHDSTPTQPDGEVFSFDEEKVLIGPGYVFSHINTTGDSLFNFAFGDLWHDDYGMIIKQGVPSLIDMGEINFAQITEAPSSGYQNFTNAVVNHCYCLITSQNKYAKIKITALGRDSVDDFFRFDWVYQTDGSRKF